MHRLDENAGAVSFPASATGTSCLETCGARKMHQYCSELPVRICATNVGCYGACASDSPGLAREPWRCAGGAGAGGGGAPEGRVGALGGGGGRPRAPAGPPAAGRARRRARHGGARRRPPHSAPRHLALRRAHRHPLRSAATGRPISTWLRHRHHAYSQRFIHMSIQVQNCSMQRQTQKACVRQVEPQHQSRPGCARSESVQAGGAPRTVRPRAVDPPCAGAFKRDLRATVTAARPCKLLGSTLHLAYSYSD